MTRQDVQCDAGRINIVRQCLRTGGFDGIQAIGEHGAEDFDHLAVAAGLSFELALNTAQGRRQVPFLERHPVAQGARFARQNRDVVERVVDCLAAAEGAIMASQDPSILPAFQMLGTGADLDRPANCAGVDRVKVLVEPHQTGFGHRRGDSMDSIELADIRHHVRTLLCECLPDRLVRDVGMFVRIGTGDASVLEPGILLRIGSELRPGHEDQPPGHAHLVLDLTLLPAGAGVQVAGSTR